MKFTTTLVAAALPLGLLAPALAAEQVADSACYVAVIPATCEVEEREIVVPPVTCEQRVPKYETLSVPVYETRCVPEWRDVHVPVMATREVPVFATERVPVWGERAETVYEEVRNPVTVCVFNPFTCEDEEITLFETCEQVPCGTRMVPCITGYDTRQVQVGTREECYEAGTETRRVVAGNRMERVQTGTREVTRCVGFETRTVVVEPARSRVVREEVRIPARRVTVVPDGGVATDPLPGTETVMSESDYRAHLATSN